MKWKACALGVSLALLLISADASGQGKAPIRKIRDEINLTIGVVPHAYNKLPSRGGYSLYDDLYDIYEPSYRDAGFIPTFTLDYSHYWTDWFKAGATGSFSQAWANKHDRMMNRRSGVKTITDFHLMGQAKFTYVNSSIFKMYAGFAAGGTFRYTDDNGEGNLKLSAAGELIPLGFMWTDNTVYGIFETALGSRMMGMRIGIGIRF